MAGFNPADYEEVKDRIPRFWEKHPDGAIHTDLLEHDGTYFIVKATLVSAEGRSIATGLAQEVVGSSNVNKTSALENCETSAIGRALANAGFSAGKNRPSREEMSKASRAGSDAGSGTATRPPARSSGGPKWRNDDASAAQKKTIERLVQQTGMVVTPWPLPDDLTKGQASDMLDLLQEEPTKDETVTRRGADPDAVAALQEQLGATPV